MSVIHGALENRQLGNKGKSTAEAGWAVAAHMEPTRQALLGRHFGTMGIHEFPGHSSFHPINFQNSHPLPGSSSPPPSPPSPQLLALGSAGKALLDVPGHPQASGTSFPQKGSGGKSACLSCSRYETAMHNHTPCLSITRPLPAPALSQKLLVTVMC